MIFAGTRQMGDNYLPTELHNLGVGDLDRAIELWTRLHTALGSVVREPQVVEGNIFIIVETTGFVKDMYERIQTLCVTMRLDSSIIVPRS